MNYEEFKKILEERLKDYLPQEYQAEISIIEKTNRKVDGLVFRGGKLQNCSPVIYVEALYKAYEETKDLDRILKDVKNVFMNALEHIPNTNNFMDKEFIKQNVVFQLINTEQNKEKLEQIPHREFLDLSVVYKVIIQNDDSNVAGGLINNYLAKELGFSEQKLFELAKENTTRMFPLVIRDMGELIGANSLGMYVITNTISNNGAVGMLYDDKLSLIAKELNSDLYVIPSSIHEVIAIKADMDVDGIAEMINEVNGNDNVVRKEEVLSNQPYFYNKMFHSISTTKEINNNFNKKVLTETLINSPTKNKNKPIER